MDMDTYRADVRRTTPDQPLREQLLYATMGIGGEAGECIDLVKKHVFQAHNLDRTQIREEAGDLLFFLVFLLDVCGITLAEAMTANVEKRRIRYPEPEGFTFERSRNRDSASGETSCVLCGLPMPALGGNVCVTCAKRLHTHAGESEASA